ncbi:MAG: 3-phosphoshikimate 1-carboxyvinyltransferase [Gammaproteobacteria bacterium]|nr:3-phosphoshikimate 1-carboxyvinyltransferase [Gammaproteobacteria bacterium]
MDYVAEPVSMVSGEIRVPGDKSISHRALMLGAIAEGTSEIVGFLAGEDCLSTLSAIEALGVRVVRHEPTRLSVDGAGLRGLAAPGHALDMGNSGTAMRIFTGLLSGQRFDSTLFGDASLSRRPMERVAAPLRLMGAQIETSAGHPPVRITGGQRLRGISYPMPVASAQVKSAVLLAGLYAEGETTVIEPAVTRDHTERMLAAFGVRTESQAGRVTLTQGNGLRATRIEVPGDLSSAAFLLLAGSVASSGELVIDDVGLNPTRTGVLEIFRLMGADFEVEARPTPIGNEPVGRIIVRPARLRGARIPRELVPLSIDEFPAVFVAAALAEGETVISGAEELRHKESDRIAVMAQGLRVLGISVEETADGARIRGGALGSGEIDTWGDHRVAMAFAAGAVRASGPVLIRDTANVATSFPGFVSLCNSIGLKLEEHGDDHPTSAG